MRRFINSFVLAAVIFAPVAPTVVRAAEDHPRKYHDNARNEDHDWDKREDRAYRMWAKENHRKYRDFAKLKEEERQSYWSWRHDHSDALLKINIR